MLLTKTVNIKWNNPTKKHYEEKGYVFTKQYDEFEVRVEDLTHGSSALVDVVCFNCDEILYDTLWYSYKKYVKEDGKYYCNKCAHKLFAIESTMKTVLKNGISLNKWCINNNRLDIINRWDYELNKSSPNEINYATNKAYWFKCSKELHKSELKNIASVTTGKGNINCKQCNSFEKWCLDSNRQDILDRWDYHLNDLNPNEISFGTNKKYYFKCPKGLHESELKSIGGFTSGQEGSMFCNQCDSFEQWCLDNDRQDVLDRWDYELNSCKPIEVNRWTSKKHYFKCPKGIHNSESKIISNFISGHEGVMDCKTCNSFAQWGIDNLGDKFLEEYWDYEKNKVSPWEIAKGKSVKVWMKCQEKDYHGSYNPQCNSFINNHRCPICNYSKGEKKIEEYLINNKIEYTPQMKYEGLIGVNSGLLSYDFLLPKYNLLIEYQGEYHDGTVSNQTEEEFKIQQEHDRRKKQYANNNKINLLEIWYWDYDNIEKILDKKTIVEEGVVM